MTDTIRDQEQRTSVEEYLRTEHEPAARFVPAEEMATKLWKTRKSEVMSHPFDLADETTRYRRRDESEERGGKEKWNPEERGEVNTPYEHSRTYPSKASGYSRMGGGLGAVDALEEGIQFGAYDPEQGTLLNDFAAFKRKHKEDNRTFSQYIHDTNVDALKIVKRERVHSQILDLEDAEPGSEISKKRRMLEAAWKDENTIVVYKYGESKNGEDDQLVFQSDTLKGARNKLGLVAVNAQGFNRFLELQNVGRLVYTPKSGEDTESVIGALQELSVNGAVFQGNRLIIERNQKPRTVQKKDERPKKEQLQKPTFNISLDRKKVEDSAEKPNIEAFWDALTKKGGQIESLVFESSERGVESVGLKLKSDDKTEPESIKISAYAFRTYLDGVKAFHDYDDPKRPISGFKMESKGQGKAMVGVIHPDTPQNELEKTVRNMRFAASQGKEGVGLSRHVKIEMQKLTKDIGVEKLDIQPATASRKPVQPEKKEKEEKKPEGEAKKEERREEAKEKVTEEPVYDLKVDQEKLADKSTDPSEGADFIRVFPDRAQEVEEFTFIADGKVMDGVGLTLKNGETHHITAALFRTVFPGIVIHANGKDNLEGFRFVPGSKKGLLVVYPTTSQDILEKVVSRLRINGAGLPDDVIVSMVEKGGKSKPIELEIKGNQDTDDQTVRKPDSMNPL